MDIECYAVQSRDVDDEKGLRQMDRSFLNADMEKAGRDQLDRAQDK